MNNEETEALSDLEFFQNRLKLARPKVKKGLLPASYITDLKKVIKALKKEVK